MSVDIDGSNIETVVETENAIGVDFHYASQILFWTDDTHNKLYSSNIDGTGVEVVLDIGLHTPENVAVDWIGNKLYVVESYIGQIDICEMDGSLRAPLLTEGLNQPRGIGLDPTEGYMFISDWGKYPAIKRAFMDGSNVVILVSDKVIWPNGLTVDIASKRIFWVDGRLDYVQSVTYNGQNRETLISGGLYVPHPLDITVFEQYVYVSDWTKMGLLKVNKFMESDYTIIVQTESAKPMGVTAYHPAKQPTVPNPCGSINGGCQQLCVVSHTTDNGGLGYRCKCKTGYELDSDQISCTKIDKFLLVTQDHVIRGISLDLNKRGDAIFPVSDRGSKYSGVDYDVRNEFLYFSDINKQWIARTKLDGSGYEPVVHNKMFSHVVSIAIDWVSNNLYYVDSMLNSLSVVWLMQTSVQRTLITNLRQPVSVVVHPMEGYLFWSEVRRPAAIFRTRGDGSNKTTIINTELGDPHGLAIDFQARKLYWSDVTLNKIERSEFDGSSRQTISVQSTSQPVSITVNGDFIYLLDAGFNKIQRVNGSATVIIREGLNDATNIKVYDINMQSGENACSRHGQNGDCSHFCFPMPSFTRHCGCPYGMKIDTGTQMSCIADPDESPIDLCPEYSFTCNNSRCVYKFWRCDGEDDCHDNSDEENCEDHTCSPMAFTCANNLCIMANWQCDGDNDCGDNSDEEDCIPPSCSSSDFTCDNGNCISTQWKCDTDNDCGDGSDEKDCESHVCAPGYFSCTSVMRCISLVWVCDGISNCADGSDEVNCPVHDCNTSSEFQCTSSKQCISLNLRCDGAWDCEDHSDEEDCPTRPPNGCHSDEFQCVGSGTCIPGNWECDGHLDCDDNSDEHGECGAVTCNPTDFKCDSHVCIPSHWVCDQYNDCVDGSDELVCPTQPFSCPDNQWLCPGTTQCIDNNDVCNGVEECPLGHDESPICNDDSCMINNGGCSHQCLQTPFGAECVCLLGQQLLNDSKVCADINECEPPGACSQTCIDEKYSFKCECGDGYMLEPDRHTCKSTNSAPVYMVVSNVDSIIRHDIQTAESTVIWDSLSNVLAVDFDASEGRIYWTEASVNRISRSYLNGTNKQVHLLFWTDWGRSPRIERAGMDGSDRTVIVTDRIYWPNGLTLDLPTERVYFGDRRLDFIEFCDYDGNNRHHVIGSTQFISGLHHMALFEDFVYWTDRENNEAMRVNKYTGQNRSAVVSLSHPLGIHINHPALQPTSRNFCENSGCSHLCVLAPNDAGFTCMCSPGYELNADGLMCEQSLIICFLLLSDVERMISQMNGSSPEMFVPTAYVGAPLSIAIDWVSRNIFWSNPNEHIIEVMKLDEEKNYRTVVFSDNVGIPGAICVDPSLGMIYWAEVTPTLTRISKGRMDGTNPQTVVNGNLGQVEYLTIDIKQQQLYWSDSVLKMIGTCNVDGTSKQDLVTNLATPKGLAVYGSYLYYSDIGFEVITRVQKSDGSDPVNLRNNFRDVQALKIFAQDSTITNACKVNNGRCHHLCLPNGPATKVCKCTIGFQLAPDGVSCNNHTSFAVVSQLTVIRGFSFSDDHEEAMVPIAGQGRFTLHVDVHMEDQYIYFADFNAANRNANGIQRIKPDGSRLRNLITTGIGKNGIRGLTVDWIAGNLYFTNAFESETYIEVCRLDGSYRLVLLKTVEDLPRAIAVNPVKKYLYWCDYGQQPKIERSNLDGSNRLVLVQNENTVYPRDICVDYQTHKVYWVDTDSEQIQRVSWDGTNIETVRSDLPNPYGLAIFKDEVFWVDRSLKNVYKASKEPGDVNYPTFIKTGIESLRDVAIFDDEIQPIGANPGGCYTSNGDCQQLCFGRPDNSFHCACATGTLLNDGKSCGDVDAFLLLANEGQVRSLHFDATDHSQPRPPMTVPGRTYSLDFDYQEKLLFYTEIFTSSVRYRALDDPSSDPVIVTDEDVNMLSGIAFDWVNKKIYVTDLLSSIIFAINMDGTDRMTIINNANNPRGIIVDPCKGQIYWISRGQLSLIERSTMSGNYREQFVSTDIGSPGGLTIDYDENKLYWCDNERFLRSSAMPRGEGFTTRPCKAGEGWEKVGKQQNR
ncbi:low-density lipoprotein receptor-related protein 2-like [Saccoglossus kowalevskii]